MKNKGFTLVELIAIIVIISAISLLSFAAITNTIKSSKARELKTFEDSLINSTKLYMSSKNDQYPDLKNAGDKYRVDVSELIQEGYVRETLVNPTNVNIKKFYVIVVKNEEGFLDYYVSKATGADVEDPIIPEYLYKETILNGSIPILDEGMIPIVINDDGSVKKANINSIWYSYQNNRWANVVLVNENADTSVSGSKSRVEYLNAAPGTNILATDILGFFVWIPSYRYNIPTVTDVLNPPNIKIIFENKTVTASPESAEYFSHPAFKFGDIRTNGFWVSKFRVSNSLELPKFIPNGLMFNTRVGEAFESAQKMKSNTYGITSDTHSIKSSEWAAISYLSYSQYGSGKQIFTNSNKTLSTGCGAATAKSASTEECINGFGESTISIDLKYPQSTTGNITGVFDLVGGMLGGVMTSFEGKIGASNFTSLPDSKYYEILTKVNNVWQINNGSNKGYAIDETAGWFGDYKDYPSSNYPWLERGGYAFYNDPTGLYYTNWGNGYSGFFMAIITPTT